MEDCVKCEALMSCFFLDTQVMKMMQEADLFPEPTDSNIGPFLSDYCDYDAGKQKEIIDVAFSISYATATQAMLLGIHTATKTRLADELPEAIGALDQIVALVAEPVIDPNKFELINSDPAYWALAKNFAVGIMSRLMKPADGGDSGFGPLKTYKLVHDCFLVIENMIREGELKEVAINK